MWAYIRGAYNRDEKFVSDLMGLLPGGGFITGGAYNRDFTVSLIHDIIK